MTNIEILTKHFGFESFKDIQESVINNLVSGESTLCLMPTGGGKSIIYQVAGLQIGKITIVISPLLALMKQQHKRLESQGIKTLSYNSSLGDAKTQFNKLKEVFASNEPPQFIFVSPEKILSDGYLEFILKKNRLKIGLIVVDEAHCISQWGHTFRPAYKAIPLFLKNIYGIAVQPPVLCLTATLNPDDKEEICNALSITKSNIFKSESLLRTNLQLSILEQANDNQHKKGQLLEILTNHIDEKIIVYTHIKAREYGTREMSKSFQELGFNCHYFDADMPDNEKLLILESFEIGETKIIFATSAFGMGIDIPDIRVVVHYLVPESIEQYYQEVGRAGRDGKIAYGYLLYSDINFKVRRDLIKKSILKVERINEIFNDTLKPTKTGSLLHKQVASLKVTDATNKIYSLSRMDIKEDNSEMIVFLYLIEIEIIVLRGKGVYFFECFDNNGSKAYQTLKEASLNGLVTRISKTLNKSIESVNHDIFTLFNDGEIKLSKVPISVLNYNIKSDVSDSWIEDLHLFSKELMEKRLNGFEKLVSLIESNSDLRETIANYLDAI